MFHGGKGKKIKWNEQGKEEKSIFSVPIPLLYIRAAACIYVELLIAKAISLIVSLWIRVIPYYKYGFEHLMLMIRLILINLKPLYMLIKSNYILFVNVSVLID